MCSYSGWRTGGQADTEAWVHFDRTMETKDRRSSVILVTSIKIDIDTIKLYFECQTRYLHIDKLPVVSASQCKIIT